MVDRESKTAWVVAFTLQVVDLTDDVLTLRFKSQYDLDTFKNSDGAPDILRRAIFDVLGLRVKFKPLMTETAQAPAEAPVAATATAPAEVIAPAVVPVTAPIELVEVPAEPAEAAEATEPIAIVEEKPVAKTPPRPRKGNVDEDARVGESLLRELLGAEPMDDGKTSGGR